MKKPDDTLQELRARYLNLAAAAEESALHAEDTKISEAYGFIGRAWTALAKARERFGKGPSPDSSLRNTDETGAQAE